MQQNRSQRSQLGGHFGPEKKYLAPPPPKFPNSLQTPSRPLGPSPRTPPPLLGFSIKTKPPPPLGDMESPLPFPEQKNKKIKNIRNVHQA